MARIERDIENVESNHSVGEFLALLGYGGGTTVCGGWAANIESEIQAIRNGTSNLDPLEMLEVYDKSRIIPIINGLGVFLGAITLGIITKILIEHFKGKRKVKR